MGYVRKERGRYRARYRDPLGRSQSKTFTRKSDAERLLRGVELDKQRGNWIDSRDGDVPLAVWAGRVASRGRRRVKATIGDPLVRRGPLPGRIGPMVSVEFERVEALELLGMTLAHLNDAEVRGEVSSRVPLLMNIRDKLALALREEP